MNNEKLTIIKNMIKSGRLPGTFIFEGSPEVTRIFADNLAKAAVCADSDYTKNNGEACGVCEACKKAGKNMHPDIIISEPESDSARSFHIDKVREIIDGLYLSPNESGKKIYVIHDMQNMTPQGQNALLKSLEEPPPFVIFIITATNLDLILETVKSRAVKFKLEHEPADYKNDCEEIIKNILSNNPDKLTVYQAMLKSLEKSGRPGILNFYYNLENALRDILITKLFTDNIDSARLLYFDNPEISEKYAGNYSVKKILELCGKIQEYRSDLEYNANTRLNLSSFFSAIIS
jgi:DNA polymerase III gamma/tau subunit